MRSSMARKTRSRPSSACRALPARRAISRFSRFICTQKKRAASSASIIADAAARTGIRTGAIIPFRWNPGTFSPFSTNSASPPPFSSDFRAAEFTHCRWAPNVLGWSKLWCSMMLARRSTRLACSTSRIISAACRCCAISTRPSPITNAPWARVSPPCPTNIGVFMQLTRSTRRLSGCACPMIRNSRGLWSPSIRKNPCPICGRSSPG